MWISKAEYNLLVQNSEIGARVAMRFAETLANLDETQLELIQVKQELKEVEQEREELAKEASGLAKELTHAELDLALYKKAFDDIAHAFGDEFRYLLMEEAIAEEKHSVEARYATWVVSNLWFVVHDIMKNAGWRVKDANT
jgi:DNA gyrase/topoisomerase IV subunit A